MNGATKAAIRLLHKSEDFDRMLNKQQERLQTGMIDFSLLHTLDRKAWEKIQNLNLIDKAEKAQTDVCIQNLDFSYHDSLNTFKTIIDGYDAFTFCQIQYNFTDVDFQADPAGLKYAADKGLFVVILESRRGGKLALDLPSTRPIWKFDDKKQIRFLL